MKANPPLVALFIFLTTIAVYVAGISPLSSALNRARASLAADEARLSVMQTEVTMKQGLQDRIRELEKANRANRDALLVPMLNSHAMRGKSFLDAIAVESGLVGMEYTEGTFRALPVPKVQLPERRTARRSVRVHARGDYAAAASFLMRVERDLPTVCLQSLSIAPIQQNATPDMQEINMAFEWPCEGEVIK